MRRIASFALLAAIALAAPQARAIATDAGAAGAAAAGAGGATHGGAAAGDAGASVSDGCVERVPEAATRPSLRDEIHPRAVSGYATVLRVHVTHGRGETVLPRGVVVDRSAETLRELEAAGFALPDQSGTAAARVIPPPKGQGAPGDRVVSIVEVPVVPLPPKPGRNTLMLPRFPITVARASGEVSTLCTSTHLLFVEDPIANIPDAKPRPNPPGRPQREEWTALKSALGWVAVGAASAAVLGAFGYFWSRRPKPAPPPPPPRPPWEVALEQLDEIRTSGLVETERYADLFDRVSDTIRQYLGARYGFDGLESTTTEVLAELANVHIGGFEAFDDERSRGEARSPGYRAFEEFLGECDLVKFAKVAATREAATALVERGVELVTKTTPIDARPRARATEAP
jgi:hypothetical protein